MYWQCHIVILWIWEIRTYWIYSLSLRLKELLIGIYQLIYLISYYVILCRGPHGPYRQLPNGFNRSNGIDGLLMGSTGPRGSTTSQHVQRIQLELRITMLRLWQASWGIRFVIFFPVFIALTIVQYISFYLYSGKFHPMAKILDGKMQKWNFVIQSLFTF